MDLGFGDLPNDDCELSRWFDRPDFGARPTQNIAPKALAQPPMPRFYDYSLEPGLHQGFTPALHTGRAADLPGRRLHRRLGATDYDTAHGPTPTPPKVVAMPRWLFVAPRNVRHLGPSPNTLANKYIS